MGQAEDDRLPASQGRVKALEMRVRYLEKMLDTRATPLWRRLLFRLDGWPSWTTVAAKPAWRPWRKWWTS